MDERQRRKSDHIREAAALPPPPPDHGTGFADVHLLHHCLADLAVEDIQLETQVGDMQLRVPLIINGMTGGNRDVAEFNRQLAVIARRFGLAMAVGSQTAALKDPSVRWTYRIVREEHPEGPILANVGALTAPEDAQEAVAMLDADALQVHLNIAQELFMPEGERDFRGMLDNLARIVEAVPVPVWVKETGCGIAAEQAREIVKTGVRVLDVGGRGGTNFIAIEARRARRSGQLVQGTPEAAESEAAFSSWGIPTVVSLVETVATVGERVDVIASGGIRDGVEVAKSLALGARAAAAAGPLIQSLVHGGESAATQWVRRTIFQLRTAMLLAGAAHPNGLASRPVVILGETGRWLERRGFDLDRFARRG